jgi:hypothetical protein
MRRLALISLASLLAFAGAARADETPPAPAVPPMASAPVAAQAHLVFRSDDRQTALVGRFTVVERKASMVVVEELSQACDDDCARRRLAWADPSAPQMRE